MIVCTTWKARPLSPEQTNRMMEVWAKTEAREAEDPTSERLCWYIASDGSSGITISRFDGGDAALAAGLEISLALSEFIELESKVVLDMDTAMPAITAAIGYL